MLAVTHSGLLLRGHCTSRHFKFKTYNCSSSYQRYQPFYLPNIIFLALCFELFLNFRGKIEKILYYIRRCAPRALKNACDKMVSYKSRIKNYYYQTLANLLPSVMEIKIKNSTVLIRLFRVIN
jgi:hypothetical protein